MMTEAESNAWRPEIPGWSSDILPFYERIAEWMPEYGHTVEVGVAHGRSMLFLMERRLELRKHFVISGVDTSPIPEALKAQTDASSVDARRTAYHCAPSGWVAMSFEDNSLDFVFIDASHDYQSVKQDIEAWLPKVRSGGIIAGHDYEPNEFPGVVQAVNEAFNGRHTMEGRTVWQVRIPEHGDHG
jgi:cephalosporin hydroxylase